MESKYTERALPILYVLLFQDGWKGGLDCSWWRSPLYHRFVTISIGLMPFLSFVVLLLLFRVLTIPSLMKLLLAGAEAMYADLGHFSPKSIKVKHRTVPMYTQCKSSNSEKVTQPVRAFFRT